MKEKLIKLLSLAENGVGGEKENAKNILNDLLEKNNMTVDDLRSVEVSLFWFSYGKGGKLYKRLITQVIMQVCGSISTWMRTGERYKVGAKVTKSEKIEIELRFGEYKKDLEAQVELTFSAFIHTNGIFSNDKTPEEAGSVSEEELLKLLAVMGTIKKTEIHKMISDN